MQPRVSLVIFANILLLFIMCCSVLNGQTTVSGSLLHKGLNRKYRLHLPPGFKPEESLPLVFNYHGFTSNGAQQELLSDMNAVSDSARFLVCYPEGINASWNVGWVFGSTADDIGFTSALIDEFYGKYNIDQNRVYACGMSNGGFMSYRLACELSSRIAAVASVTGSMVPQSLASCKPGRPVPVMEIHGTADNIVSYSGSPIISASIPDVLRLWQRNNGCNDTPEKSFMPNINTEDGTTTELWVYQNCSENGELVHYRVLNGGHTWPGAAGFGLGTSLDFHASTVIWQFFSKRKLPETSTSGLGTADTNLLMNAFPNPAEDLLTLTFSGNSDYRISLFSVTGALIWEKTVYENPVQVPLVNLMPGVYHLMVNGGDSYASLKLVKL